MRPSDTAPRAKAMRDRAAGGGWWVRLAMLVAAVLAAPVMAQAEQTPQTYRLAPGDRVSVVVFGQADFSGDMLIDAAGNIRLPFVGPIEVANLTLSECQKRIVDRLAEGILNKPNVNVQISEFSPIFVLGDVRTAGVQPFKLGMTVKAAVAVAGGFGIVPPVQNTLVTELLASEERLRQLTLEKAILTIRKTRLEAQRDGAAFPADQASGRDEDNLSDIVALEKETFDSQMAIQQSQIDLLRAQKPRIESEIEALNTQLAAKRKQLELVRQNVEQYNRLTKQGLGLSSTEMQLKLTEANYESEVGNLSAQIARLKMDLGALDIRIQEADATFKRQILVELRDARDRLKNLDVTLPIAREVRDAKLQQTGNVTDIGIGMPRSITITRTRGGQQTVLAADEATVLEPGDIVEVQLRLARGRPFASGMTPQLDTGSLVSLKRDAILVEAPRR